MLAGRLEFGRRYKISRPGVTAVQDNEPRTDFASPQDRSIPVGTTITVGDWTEVWPYSSSLTAQGSNPGFYYVSTDTVLPNFVSRKLIVLAHLLEKSVELVDAD